MLKSIKFGILDYLNGLAEEFKDLSASVTKMIDNLWMRGEAKYYAFGRLVEEPYTEEGWDKLIEELNLHSWVWNIIWNNFRNSVHYFTIDNRVFIVDTKYNYDTQSMDVSIGKGSNNHTLNDIEHVLIEKIELHIRDVLTYKMDKKIFKELGISFKEPALKLYPMTQNLT